MKLQWYFWFLLSFIAVLSLVEFFVEPWIYDSSTRHAFHMGVIALWGVAWLLVYFWKPDWFKRESAAAGRPGQASFFCHSKVSRLSSIANCSIAAV